ncbi:hypothetical protein D3C72_2021600 [compost metagenome]
MAETIYAVIEISTGRLRFGQTYTKPGGAKLALKNRLNVRDWPKHGIASITINPTVIATVGENGKWVNVEKTEVAAE